MKMLDYRDPLFSIIVFLSLIIIVILVTNFLENLKEKRKNKHLKEFIEQFDFLDDKEINSIFSNDISINALILLAIGFEKEGNYEKALNIYLNLLQKVNKIQKFEILQNMAEVYLKAGFLHKARESLLEILRSKPRDIKALKTLIIVDDKLKNYDEIENIIEIFEELELDIEDEKAYILFKQAVFKGEKDKLFDLVKQYPILKREFISYFIYKDKQQVLKIINNNDVYEMIDIFWNEKLACINESLKQIEAAKKLLVYEKECPIFEIEVLKHLPKDLADLEFEYICKECKRVFPIYDSRCPNCKNLFTMEVEIIITKA
jgi:lipopolysaccharide biosynthesis regulator YciM